jgi:putative phage-type endonuclease
MSIDIHALHQQGIGASMIAGVCGASPWSSPYSVYQEMTGGVPAKTLNAAMARGIWLEATVVDAIGAYAKSDPAHTVTKLHRNSRPKKRKTDGFVAIAIPDAYIFDEDGRQPSEAKTGSRWASADWVVELPLWYYMQTQWQMYVEDAVRCYVGADLPGVFDPDYDPASGLPPILYRVIPRDQVVIDGMVRKAHAFWHTHFIPRIAPPIDGSKATGDTLGAMYPPDETRLVCTGLPDEAADLVAEFEAAKEAEAQDKLRKDAAKHALQQMLGEWESGVVNGSKVNWKPQTRRTIDSKRLRKHHPRAADKYTNVTTTRVFSTERNTA